MRHKVLLPLTRKKRTGMVPEQFYLLEEGDIVSYGKSRTPRIILKTSKTELGETGSIHLLKLRPSWTKSPNTIYCSGDSHQFTPLKVKNAAIWDITYDSAMEERLKSYKEYHRRKWKESVAKLETRLQKLDNAANHLDV